MTTTCLLEISGKTQGNDLEHSKNVIDWTIRSELLRANSDLPTKSVHRLSGSWNEEASSSRDFLRYSQAYCESSEEENVPIL